MVDGRDALFLAFKSGYQNLFVTMHLPDSLGGGMHYLGSDAKGLDVEVKHLHMVLTPDGRPVVVYYPQGGSGTLEAMEWVGTLGSPPVGTWSPIGKARTIGSASYSAPSVAVGADGTLYVAFADDLRDYRLTVRMFAPNADTEWQPVGPPGFSDTPVANPLVAVTPSGALYTTYRNGSYFGLRRDPTLNLGVGAAVFDGASWAPLGHLGLGREQACVGNRPGLAFVGGTPYIGIMEDAVVGQSTDQLVLTLDQAGSGDWMPVGGGLAANGSCATAALTSVAASARRVCAAVGPDNPDLPQGKTCALIVACIDL